MADEAEFCALSCLELWLSGPREGDETEVIEKGGGSGESKRASAALFSLGPRKGDGTEGVDESPASDAVALDPRDGDETEVTERDGGGGSKLRPAAIHGDPREGDETTPIRESPLGPPVRV
jgi:hypothetical protein